MRLSAHAPPRRRWKSTNPASWPVAQYIIKHEQSTSVSLEPLHSYAHAWCKQKVCQGQPAILILCPFHDARLRICMHSDLQIGSGSPCRVDQHVLRSHRGYQRLSQGNFDISLLIVFHIALGHLPTYAVMETDCHVTRVADDQQFKIITCNSERAVSICHSTSSGGDQFSNIANYPMISSMACAGSESGHPRLDQIISRTRRLSNTLAKQPPPKKDVQLKHWPTFVLI